MGFLVQRGKDIPSYRLWCKLIWLHALGEISSAPISFTRPDDETTIPPPYWTAMQTRSKLGYNYVIQRKGVNMKP